MLLSDISLGLSSGDVIGLVGRNGDGKSTLLGILTGTVEPDSGRVTRTNAASIALLSQTEDVTAAGTVRDLIVGGEPDHVWASDPMKREIVEQLLSEISLDAELADLSGGERRRASLVAMMLGHHDLLVLDEPTNHLDVEAVNYLAKHLNTLAARGVALLVVSHDRWVLDAICNRIWEVHDATVEVYDGGYAAYVLARAERARQAAATEARRKNLLRKELAWLRRGAPARTSKPKFRIEAANQLIVGEPEPRDRLALQRFATARLGKDVIDFKNATYTLETGRALVNNLTWSIGPGDRIGLVGANGAGKTTLLRLMADELEPTAGRVKHGKTLRLRHLSQHVTELDDDERVLDSVNRIRRQTQLATGRDASASSLLEEFGFTGDRLVARIGDLSGGERRRLQFLRLLMEEPNVLLLDEPTNDLDIDTLTVVEDYLDTWPGTLIVASHDRYFLERVCDVTYSMLGDGRVLLLPGGIDEFLAKRAAQSAAATVRTATPTTAPASDAARSRAAKKDLARIEGQLERLSTQIDKLHEQMATSATDYAKLERLNVELSEALARQADLEDQWLSLAE